MPQGLNLLPGDRISVRGEDFLITDVKDNYQHSKLLYTEGISELVKGRRFIFDTALENGIQVIDPANTRLIADTTNGYLKTKLVDFYHDSARLPKIDRIAASLIESR